MRILTTINGEYWEFNEQIFRRTATKAPPALDVEGRPMDLRWECSRAHFDRYLPLGIYGVEEVTS